MERWCLSLQLSLYLLLHLSSLSPTLCPCSSFQLFLFPLFFLPFFFFHLCVCVCVSVSFLLSFSSSRLPRCVRACACVSAWNVRLCR